MGRFIISRSAAGDRFLLQSDTGRTLAVSRAYATLDACKKGICSLVTYLPLSPVVDASAGETGPNPKCEIAKEGGGYVYYIKSPNGKTLLSCQPMQTKKAVLRAVSMLKEGVLEAEVLFWRKAGYTPLKVRLPDGAEAQAAEKREDRPAARQKTRPVAEAEPRPAYPDENLPVNHRLTEEEWAEPALPDEEPADMEPAESSADMQDAPCAETAPTPQPAPIPVREERPQIPKPSAAIPSEPPQTSASPRTPAKPPESPAVDPAAPGAPAPARNIFGKIRKVR